MKGCDDCLRHCSFLPLTVSKGARDHETQAQAEWAVVSRCGSLQGPRHLPSAPRDCRMHPLGGSVSVPPAPGPRWDTGILPLRGVEISQAIVENKSF